jgi:hypothetical protein
MKANELRVGNYVKGIGHNISWLVEGIETDYIHSSNAWRLLSSFEPIPLNTKWLEKFGFEYSEFEDLYQKGGYDVDTKDNVYCHFYINEYGDWYKDIEYVHQLQNLYFALTGEELTIKDTANG